MPVAANIISSDATAESTDTRQRLKLLTRGPAKMTAQTKAVTNPGVRYSPEPPNGATAFCRIPRENHSTIARKDGNFANPVTPTLIAAALTVDDAGFDAHLAELSRINAEHRREEAATPYTHGYQNTVFRVDDNHGAMVPDYFIEAFARTADERDEDAAVTAKIQNDIIASVQINQVFSSFRAIKINCDRLQTLLKEIKTG